MIEFRNPNVERMVSLTPADRKWMDDIVTDVNDGYSEDPDMSLNATMQYVCVYYEFSPAMLIPSAASEAATTTFARSSRSTSWLRCRPSSTLHSCQEAKGTALSSQTALGIRGRWRTST